MSISSAPGRRRRRGSPAGAHRAGRARTGTRPPRWRRRPRCPAAARPRPAPAGGTGTRPHHGTSGRSGSGRTALAHSATILPVVSVPSSVVRSMQRIARSSAQTFVSRLIDGWRARPPAPRARRRRPRVARATMRAASAAVATGPGRAAWGQLGCSGHAVHRSPAAPSSTGYPSTRSAASICGWYVQLDPVGRRRRDRARSAAARFTGGHVDLGLHAVGLDGARVRRLALRSTTSRSSRPATASDAARVV